MALFEPITINGVTLPNRIVKSAMGEGLADAQGRPTPALEKLYARWARGGVGLAITGIAHVRQGCGVTGKEIGLYEDALVAPLRQVTAAAHRFGGRIFAQICHAPPQLLRQRARAVGAVAPSPFFSPTNLLWHRAISSEELDALVGDFGAAARRAREAGFDGVQLHGGHGYLLSRMISPRYNRRRDRWGGSFARRLAFFEAVVAAVRAEVGADYPLIVKLNAHDGRAGGLDLDEALRIGQRLQELSIDAIEVSAGVADVALGFYPTRGEIPLDLSEQFLRREFPLLSPVVPLFRPVLRRIARRVALGDEPFFLAEARRFAEALRIPVICVGGIRSRAQAERLLGDTRVAMVSLARPLVRQPFLPNAWKEQLADVGTCTSCNRCFVSVGLGRGLRCRCTER